MGVDFTGQYASLQCTDNNKGTVQTALSAKLTNLDCVKNSSCEASVTVNGCGASRKRRAASVGIDITISIFADTTSGGDFNVVELMQNNSGKWKILFLTEVKIISLLV